jgi:hypothetical protein
MYTFIVQTTDRELARAIWGLQIHGIQIEESMNRSQGTPTEVIAYVQLGSALLTFATALFQLIKTKQHKGPHTTKTIIHTRKQEVDLQQLVARYEESIYIEIREEK